MINIKISFSVAPNGVPKIETNAKPTALGEILEAWLRAQQGEGSDVSPVIQRDTYTIEITYYVADDQFTWKHDCGNAGLATGIVFAVFQGLDQ